MESSVRRVGEAELVDERQLRVREQVLSMLRAHGGSLADRASPRATSRDPLFVVGARAERTLVMLHAKLGRWLQPGVTPMATTSWQVWRCARRSRRRASAGCGSGSRRSTSTSRGRPR
ncbi:MAG: hypothetical protein R2716_03930 [Microthrixaceae bacterium]